jgi:two-component system, OmpR family, phosphate regulon response regulator PhoB
VISSVDEQIRVIFVEDDPEFVEMYRMALEVQGYAVEVASDGRTGLEMIRERKPDLVFLDMRMPGLTGLEVLREMRADPSTAEIPAVVLTNYDEPAMIDEAYRLGALQWLVKVNTTPRTLVERMGGWLTVVQGEGRDS